MKSHVKKACWFDDQQAFFRDVRVAAARYALTLTVGRLKSTPLDSARTS